MMRDCVSAANGREVFHARAIAVASVFGTPSRLRQVVCVGKIVQLGWLDDGRCNVVLHGVARARLLRVDAPTEDRLYHQAICEPIAGSDGAGVERGVRREVLTALRDPSLYRFPIVEQVRDVIEAEGVPPCAALDVTGNALVHDDDQRYALLCAESIREQGEIIWRQVRRMQGLARAAGAQSQGRWPRGTSWN